MLRIHLLSTPVLGVNTPGNPPLLTRVLGANISRIPVQSTCHLGRGDTYFISIFLGRFSLFEELSNLGSLGRQILVLSHHFFLCRGKSSLGFSLLPFGVLEPLPQCVEAVSDD